MSELVERVARAICEADGDEGCGNCDRVCSFVMKNYARAAIAEVLDWLAEEDRKLAPWFNQFEMKGLRRILRKEALDQ